MQSTVLASHTAALDFRRNRAADLGRIRVNPGRIDLVSGGIGCRTPGELGTDSASLLVDLGRIRTEPGQNYLL